VSGQSFNYQAVLDAADVADCLPNIVGKYKRTSDPTLDYNCLAWAVGVQWAWFDPSTNCVGYYWPDGVERDWTEKAIRSLLAKFGVKEECENPDLEDGYDKVAFFVDREGIPTHFARQLENGKWTSKLGELIDIEHETLECMEGDEPHYGRVKFYLKRKVANRS
jgi:hypothetical protein